jgi:hypothetical protein
MCLSRVFRGKEKREALAKLPDEFPVWKYLHNESLLGLPSWFTEFSLERVFAGEMRASYLGKARTGPGRRSNAIRSKLRAYMAGWHAYVKRPPSFWSRTNTRCVAKKKHIREIGMQDGCLVVVLSHITFPKKCGKAAKTGETNR